MIQTKQNQKIKFIILVILLNKQTTMPKSPKQKVKFQMLVVQQKKNALTTVENIIPNINNLVEKTDYDTKIAEIETH